MTFHSKREGSVDSFLSLIAGSAGPGCRNRPGRTFLLGAVLLGVALLASTSPAKGQTSRHALVIDPYLSARAGAENLVTVQRGTYAVTDRYLKAQFFPEDTIFLKGLGTAYRAGKIILVDNLLATVAAVTQHEIFGHGARLREFGIEVSAYRIGLPWPYGRGGGYTRFPQAHQLSVMERATAVLGGVSATALMAENVRERAFLRGRTHYRESILYVKAAWNLPLYGEATSGTDESGDIAIFRRQMNKLADAVGASRVKLGNLKRRIRVVSLLDPYQWIALYGILGRYGLIGDASFETPHFSIGGVDFLPSVRLSLAPYGTEVLVSNLLRFGGRLLDVYGRGGTGPLGPSWGAGATLRQPLRRWPATLEARLDLWRQPDLALGQEAITRTQHVGANARVHLYRQLFSDPAPLYLRGGVGFKTEGFLPGAPLGAGPHFSFGIGLKMR